MERTSNIQPRRFYRPDRTAIILFAVFVVLALVTAIFAFNFFSNLIKGWTVTNLPGAPSVDNNSGANQNPGLSQPLQPASGPASKPWDGKSRINILLIGLDYRVCDSTHDYETCDICDPSYLNAHKNDPAKLNKCVAGNTSTASHSDTMILFTVDPVTMTAGMLSIPRDLWVDVPNYGFYKINTAYFLGEANHLPGGGPQKVMDTVSDFLGIPIQYYLRIDFNVFIKLIDEIKGVTVTPDQDLIVRNANNYPVTLKAGIPVTLDGVMALSYARERHQTFGGDFDRSKRQQEVIMSIRNRVLNYNMLPTLVAKAPILYAEVSSGVHTNLGFDQVIQLAQLVLNIPADSILKTSIGTDALVEGRSPDGLSIYLPIPDKIRLLRDQLFVPGSTTQPMGTFTGNTGGSLQSEAARITVQNATNTGGLGETTASYLQSLGLNVIGVSNANNVSDGNAIYVYSSKPYTLSYLANLFGVGSSSIWNSFDPNATTDFIVVLGTSWANNNPMPK
jgi:polyisoprenyl-teichoic acid--peptidoglycan teichoic acid transferase